MVRVNACKRACECVGAKERVRVCVCMGASERVQVKLNGGTRNASSP